MQLLREYRKEHMHLPDLAVALTLDGLRLAKVQIGPCLLQSEGPGQIATSLTMPYPMRMAAQGRLDWRGCMDWLLELAVTFAMAPASIPPVLERCRILLRPSASQ